jgi:hypothetical protein
MARRQRAGVAAPFCVSYRSLPGHPDFIAELSDWNFSIGTPDSEFEFTPPAGVTQVELAAEARTRHLPRSEQRPS